MLGQFTFVNSIDMVIMIEHGSQGPCWTHHCTPIGQQSSQHECHESQKHVTSISEWTKSIFQTPKPQKSRTRLLWASTTTPFSHFYLVFTQGPYSGHSITLRRAFTPDPRPGPATACFPVVPFPTSLLTQKVSVFAWFDRHACFHTQKLISGFICNSKAKEANVRLRISLGDRAFPSVLEHLPRIYRPWVQSRFIKKYHMQIKKKQLSKYGWYGFMRTFLKDFLPFLFQIIFLQ